MACNQCAVKFNFFHKENGCPNCGLSFCNKCLKNKIKVPNKGEIPINVCKICYNQLIRVGNSVVPNSNVVIPPETYFKRIEGQDKISETVNAPSVSATKNKLSPVDQKMYERLEKLKERKGTPISEAELRKRLAKLKGENLVEGTSKNMSPLVPLDTRSDREKTDDLLEQFVKERDIELQHDPQEEIEARLATLREKGVRPNEGPFLNNLVDTEDGSDEEINKITKKVMAEVALEEKISLAGKKSSQASSDDDFETDEVNTQSTELPWCVLCNNDAKFRCLDCGGDLYCVECNREVHQTWGDTDHKVIPYKPCAK